MKKNILICGYPNTVLRIFIDVLKDQYTVYFLSYSNKAQYTEIKKILGDTAYLLDTESGSKLAKLSKFLRLFTLSFRIASDKNTQLFVAYHNHFIKNGLLMILLKWCFPRIKRINFPYDIIVYEFPIDLKYQYLLKKEHMYIKDIIHNWLSLCFDKICFEYADKHITKGFKDELIYVKSVYKIHKKPHFVFNRLIENKDLVNKQIQKLKDDPIHLVSIGGVSNSNVADNNYRIFEELLKEKRIILHVYSHTSDLLKALQNNKNLIVHSYISNHSELIKEISKYDFGISLSIPSPDNFIQAKMASGIRIYDYLTAGLPIITDTEHTSIANMITTNNFGLVIPLNEIRNIMTCIAKNNYELLLLSVKKNRENFIVETHKDEVLKFLNE
jgi:hypothetical protein